jgi:hypothetical protein
MTKQNQRSGTGSAHSGAERGVRQVAYVAMRRPPRPWVRQGRRPHHVAPLRTAKSPVGSRLATCSVPAPHRWAPLRPCRPAGRQHRVVASRSPPAPSLPSCAKHWSPSPHSPAYKRDPSSPCVWTPSPSATVAAAVGELHPSLASAVAQPPRNRNGEPERGSEWEPIKILLEGDRGSNKMNTTSNTRLRLTTQVGQDYVATGVLLALGTNNQLHRPVNAAEHQLEPYWPPPVRPVSTTGQTGPCWWNLGTSTKRPPHRSGWCSSPVRLVQARKPQIYQTGLPSFKLTQTWNIRNTRQQRTHPNVHPSKTLQESAPVKSVRGTGQTGVTWVLGMNSTRGPTPPNPTPDLPNSSTDLHKTLGIVGTPHGHSIAKILSTKTC